ncbi:MAG: hypothetical protein ACD_75C02053G0001 [uncultured bacterium]|nr:MAG: hypothetical protein ACD_75C02053G0001 [uncultured bacterium]
MERACRESGNSQRDEPKCMRIVLQAGDHPENHHHGNQTDREIDDKFPEDISCGGFGKEIKHFNIY